MGRNHLAHTAGDASNAVLAATGDNVRLLIRWLGILWLRLLTNLAAPPRIQTA
jgi:transposase, IS5 family